MLVLYLMSWIWLDEFMYDFWTGYFKCKRLVDSTRWSMNWRLPWALIFIYTHERRDHAVKGHITTTGNNQTIGSRRNTPTPNPRRAKRNMNKNKSAMQKQKMNHDKPHHHYHPRTFR